MFSGIIEYITPVKSINKKAGNILVSVKKPRGFKCNIGDSISIDGVCSTIIKQFKNDFEVEYMTETLKKTRFNDLKEKQILNIEMSLKLNDLMHGHIVTGHIDSVGIVSAIAKKGDSWILDIKYSSKFMKLIVEKGSIAINGISLTVFNVKNNVFSVSLITHTINNTNLQYLKKNDKVNLEFDLIAKYVQRNCAI